MFGSEKIISEVGAQQGDPAGPMLFCLSIHPIIKELQSEFNTWYLDDGTLGGPPESVLADLMILIEKCKSIGLEINPEKCELFFCSKINQDMFQSFSKIAPGIRIVTEDLTLLGAPLIKSATIKVLNNKLEELKFFSMPTLHFSYFVYA